MFANRSVVLATLALMVIFVGTSALAYAAPPVVPPRPPSSQPRSEIAECGSQAAEGGATSPTRHQRTHSVHRNGAGAPLPLTQAVATIETRLKGKPDLVGRR